MKKFFQFFFLIFLFLFFSQPIFSFTIEDLPQTEVKGDFVLSPGKIEVWLNPGETVTKEITVTNRLGKEMNFYLEIEDFKGSKDPTIPVILLGGEKGPYSLKDFFKLQVSKFTLKHGQRARIPIEISIPQNAEPGGKYGAVIVATEPQKREGEEDEKTAPGVAIVARLASLFFVRVKGNVEENGFLKDFQTDKKFYKKPPIFFRLYFENNGNVHLLPYGLIKVENLLGKKVVEIEIEPFFALPESLRLREVKFEGKFLFGKYKATALINRGYQNIVDQRQVEFWVLPWDVILMGGIVLFFVFFLLHWILTHFEIRRKK